MYVKWHVHIVKGYHSAVKPAPWQPLQRLLHPGQGSGEVWEGERSVLTCISVSEYTAFSPNLVILTHGCDIRSLQPHFHNPGRVSACCQSRVPGGWRRVPEVSEICRNASCLTLSVETSQLVSRCAVSVWELLLNNGVSQQHRRGRRDVSLCVLVWENPQRTSRRGAVTQLRGKAVGSLSEVLWGLFRPNGLCVRSYAEAFKSLKFRGKWKSTRVPFTKIFIFLGLDLDLLATMGWIFFPFDYWFNYVVEYFSFPKLFFWICLLFLLKYLLEGWMEFQTAIIMC